MTSLTKWYATSPRLRQLVNLVIVAGVIDASESKDREEIDEIHTMHDLISKYQLKGQFRWIAAQTDRTRNGELYRCIADTRGAFVQPALYEAFGLTVVEAMSCGLPTFATNQGGPLEIIVDEVSGFHIDPRDGEASSRKIVEFFERCKVEPQCWERVSVASHSRINECYTWKMYAQRVLNMSSIYGFWKQLNTDTKRAKQRYIELLYNLQFRTLARKMSTPAEDEGATTSHSQTPKLQEAAVVDQNMAAPEGDAHEFNNETRGEENEVPELRNGYFSSIGGWSCLFVALLALIRVLKNMLVPSNDN